MSLPEQIDGQPHQRPSGYVKTQKRQAVRNSRQQAREALRRGEEPENYERRYKGWER